ncbi:holin [Paenibacillus glucanolyticus]|uniref:holin n=1 Tax=Paenibacillus glucanolyticus TaxID=59843 RepID=UPI0030D13F9F
MTTKWFKAAGIRAIKTAAQTAIGVIGATTVMNEVDWYVVGGTVLLATITSFLTSLAGLPEVASSQEADRK